MREPYVTVAAPMRSDGSKRCWLPYTPTSPSTNICASARPWPFHWFSGAVVQNVWLSHGHSAGVQPGW